MASSIVEAKMYFIPIQIRIEFDVYLFIFEFMMAANKYSQHLNGINKSLNDLNLLIYEFVLFMQLFAGIS